MKFYIQNGKHKTVINSDSEEKAISRFLYKLILSGEATLDLKSLTYLSQAGFFKDIMACEDNPLLIDTVKMKITGSYVRYIDMVSTKLRDEIAEALEKVLVIEKQLKGSKRVIQEFFDTLKQ